jgi:hypothetical protein
VIAAIAAAATLAVPLTLMVVAAVMPFGSLAGDLNEWFLWGRPLRMLHRIFPDTPHRRTWPAHAALFAVVSESTQAEPAGKEREPYARMGILYDQITGDEDARVCKGIPDAACRHLPRNFFACLAANFLSKVADELSSARLVLPWLLGAVAAPAAFVGFLVPIREAGVLLPQLAVAAYIRRLSRRKASGCRVHCSVPSHWSAWL